jgi:hypothetical protein
VHAILELKAVIQSETGTIDTETVTKVPNNFVLLRT